MYSIESFMLVCGGLTDGVGVLRLPVFAQPIACNHPDFDYVLRQIMEQDELARIFLLGKSARNRWRDQLAARIYANIGTDLATNRIYFLNDVDTKQRLLLAGAADAVMANIHLTSQRSTIQAFTAGVPVVTLPGELWGSRIAYALYMQMGMTDLVAKSLDEYAALALRLARDPEFRGEMVAKIHERRGRLNEDESVVEGWERFLDQAGSELYPTADGDEDADEYDDTGDVVDSADDGTEGELGAGIGAETSSNSTNRAAIASHQMNASAPSNNTLLRDVQTSSDKGNESDKEDTDGDERGIADNVENDEETDIGTDDTDDTDGKADTDDVDDKADKEDMDDTDDTDGTDDTDDMDDAEDKDDGDGADEGADEDEDDANADDDVDQVSSETKVANDDTDRREDPAEADEEREREEL
ncbi:hypothetical protein PybrP1_010566 [[Pythium] brassicae (nom. inval.)]|nr:hypothetical protein PybrP1_010566 [[Pythium] brassicae (nom. inval.)]